MQNRELNHEKSIKNHESDFLDYWKEIDIIRDFDGSDIEGILYQTVRKTIIEILSSGREITVEGTPQQLYVFNANQLLNSVNQKLKGKEYDKVKKSNLYFHLQKLEEHGMVQTVGYIPSGTRLISYYGRTARVFLIHQETRYQESILTDDALPKLMRTINPNLSEEEIEDLIEGIKRLYEPPQMTQVRNWITKYEEELRSTDIDIRHLHNLFYKILLFDDRTISALRRFARALDLEIDS